MQPAIRVENLSKSYRVAHNQQRGDYRTLRDSIVDAVKAPFRRVMNRGESAKADDFWALKDVSFEVQPGEVVGIIGSNGAGKSTLLKILSRITKPTMGRIELNGRVGSLLEVGTGFHPELTGRENIYLNGSILGMSRKEIAKKFDEILAFAGVETFLDLPVKRYSSGMYVRLAFAVAAHLELEILVVDEVLAVGDQAFQQKCLGKMKDVTQSGRTVLFVSHNMAAVRALCNRGVFVESGCIRHIGDVDSTTEYYIQSQAGSEAGVDINRLPAVSRDGTLILKTASLRKSPSDLIIGMTLETSRLFSVIGVGFAIRTLDGIVLVSQGPLVTGIQLFDLLGVVDVTITIHDSLGALTGGMYILDLWIAHPGIEYILRLENLMRFEVPERDPYTMGHALVQRIHGPCHLTATSTSHRIQN
jgi:lipopolysaccharide transport system ATP-binding protein